MRAQFRSIVRFCYPTIIVARTLSVAKINARIIFPECENKIVVWNIHDPYFSPNEYTEKIFEQIRQKVKELADSL